MLIRGEGNRRLGEVAELALFFRVLGAALYA